MRVPVRFLASAPRDAQLRQAVFDAITDPRRRETLLPLLESLASGEGDNVVAAALYLLSALSARRGPRLDLVSPLAWTSALQWLFEDRPPELLRPISRRLLERFPDAMYLREVDRILAAAPPRLPTVRFRDRLGAAVQLAIAPQPDVTALLVCFSGVTGQIGMPVNYFHRWVSRLPAHVLYLRDRTEAFFSSGIAEIGSDWTSLLEFIRGLAGALGVERLAVYGSSMGGFPAIRAGVELQAPRIVSMSGTAEHERPERRADPASQDPEAARRRWAQTICALLTASPSPVEIACVFGAGNRADAADAQALAGLPGIRLVPLPGYRRHNAGIHLAMTNRIEHVLSWLVGAGGDLTP